MTSRDALLSLQRALRQVSYFRRLNEQRQVSVARDIWAVAIGLRAALLMDVVLLQSNALDELVCALSRLDIEPLRSIGLIHEPHGQQTFLVNVNLLKYELDSFERGEHSRRFVRVDTDNPRLVRAAAKLARFCVKHAQYPFGYQPALPMLRRISGALQKLEQTWQTEDLPIIVLDSSSDAVQEREMVAVAALLCGYPVIYCFEQAAEETSTEKNALAQTPLWVLQAKLLGQHEEDNHVLFQCSMPVELFPRSVEDETSGLSVNDIANAVQALVSTRLVEASSSGKETIWRDVQVTIDGPITRDRVAL